MASSSVSEVFPFPTEDDLVMPSVVDDVECVQEVVNGHTTAADVMFYGVQEEEVCDDDDEDSNGVSGGGGGGGGNPLLSSSPLLSGASNTLRSVAPSAVTPAPRRTPAAIVSNGRVALSPSSPLYTVRRKVGGSGQVSLASSLSSVRLPHRTTTAAAISAASVDPLEDDEPSPLSPLNKLSRPGTGWQQQQVSIKTLEGEFSVTMWASGADDGKK